MALLILIGLLIPPALAYIGLIGWVPAVVAEFVILFAAAWNFDRQPPSGRSRPQVGRGSP